MVRKSIFDILETKYDISNEFDKITLLFHNPMIEYSPQ